MLLGNLLFAAVFGEVILAMSNAKRGADAYAARMRSINEALEHQNIPRKFRRRVQRFYEFVWLSEHTQKITGEYLQELPQALKVDIVSSSFSHLLRRMPFFEGLGDDAISTVADDVADAA